ncbi:MAG: DUF4145 domain-containing protein [Candidatus Neomarinimicrobiota bacterium]
MKLRMTEDEYFSDLTWIGLIGAIAGAVGGAYLSGKTPLEEEIVTNYNIEQKELERKQRLLEPILELEKLKSHSNAFKIYVESVELFLNGYYRASCIFAAALLEHILKNKFGHEKGFSDLINIAYNTSLLSKSDRHFLDGIREERNSLIHDFSYNINEDEAKTLLYLSVALINRLL